MREFVLGDVHGCYKGLKQVLERSKFDYEVDKLISLGDIVDGWNETYECVEELLKVKNLVAIRGNHDKWFEEYLTRGTHSCEWLHGGVATAESYIKHADRECSIYPRNGGYITNLTFADIPLSHQKFFKDQHNYYIDDNNRCFVHGGFNRHNSFKGQPHHVYYWDRDLWLAAMSWEAMSRGTHNKEFKMRNNFSEIYIGHTSTGNWGEVDYMKAANIYNVDTGGGFEGRICLLDINSKEAYYSDLCKDLYPEQQGRN